MFRSSLAVSRRTVPLLVARPRIQPLVERRYFSAKAIYASFPCTLHYYSPRQTSSLYVQADQSARPYHIVDEEVSVSEDGLIYPAVKATSISNGATMFPNTFMFQELARRYFDENIDREEDGETVETPYIYTITKGTRLPTDLILINDYISKFSLQPSRGMPVEELNRVLDELYERCAHKETADHWLDNHQFQDALADDKDSQWMAQ